jgi:hypothetical protein
LKESNFNCVNKLKKRSEEIRKKATVSDLGAAT